MFLLILLLVIIGIGQAHIENEKQLAPITAFFVSFEDSDNAQLMIEAALLLSQHDFDCTLVLVGQATRAKHIPPLNARLKVHVVQSNSSADDEKGCDLREPLPECQVRAHLRACEALLDNKLTVSAIKEPPRLLFLPGLLHDACILTAFAGVNTAAVVWSTGPVSAAWLGHVTNAVPFSPHRAPLTSSPASSKLERFSAYWAWSKFINKVEEGYWWPAMSIVTSRTHKVAQSIDDAYLRVSLLMSASHALIERPLPSLPMRVNVGCFHCRHAQAIAQELQEWLRPRRSGLVVSTWPAEARYETLLRATALALPQFAVLWLSDHVPSDPVLPANLVLHDTCSLQDAIGHPRARLLLSECSETSVMETVFHGVPVLCTPGKFDHQEPAQRATHLGIGLLLVTPHEAEVINASKYLTTNASFRHAARHLGVMIRDEPETSADRLVFWAGHAARHWGHGHEDLTARKTPRDLTGLFDVGIVIGVLIGLVTAALCLVLVRQAGVAWKLIRVSRTKTE